MGIKQEISDDDLEDGEMREVLFTYGEDEVEYPVLLVKEEGEVTALGARCSHYKGVLADGAYFNGVIRCPLHGACFNAKTGDIEDFPGLDSLPVFNISRDKGKIFLEFDDIEDITKFRSKPMCNQDSEQQTYVILGGGPAALSCAETLRQNGFFGRVIMVIKEKHLPYDRIKLSKSLSTEVDSILLRQRDYFKEHDIELLLDAEVVALNLVNKSVMTKRYTHLSYSKLLIATGSSPRIIPFLGGEKAKNICFLRSPEDANLIHQKAVGQDILIVGSSFIGMEVAACLSSVSKSVTVVSMDEFPFQIQLGPEVGECLKKWHVSKGIRFQCKTTVRKVHTEPVNGDVYEVVLNNAKIIPACLIVVGVGIIPNTGFLKNLPTQEERSQPSIDLTPEGFIKVSSFMETSVPDVYAAGDIVQFPLPLADDEPVSIGHWQMALKMGNVAAKNMWIEPEKNDNQNEEQSVEGQESTAETEEEPEAPPDPRTAFKSVPVFWSMQYGKSLRYAGYNAGYDDIIVHGSLAVTKVHPEPNFLVYYVKEGTVVAAASLNRDPFVMQFAEALRNGFIVEPDHVREDPAGFWEPLKAWTLENTQPQAS